MHFGVRVCTNLRSSISTKNYGWLFYSTHDNFMIENDNGTNAYLNFIKSIELSAKSISALFCWFESWPIFINSLKFCIFAKLTYSRTYACVQRHKKYKRCVNRPIKWSNLHQKYHQLFLQLTAKWKILRQIWLISHFQTIYSFLV